MQRNREKRHRERVRLDRERKQGKAKLRSIDNIQKFIQEADAENAARAERRRVREEQKQAQLTEKREGLVFGSKKIGRYRYEQLAVDFQLPQDLPKHLGSVKVDAGLPVRSYYENVLKRGLVQPAAEQGRRKLKSKLRYKFAPLRDDK